MVGVVIVGEVVFGVIGVVVVVLEIDKLLCLECLVLELIEYGLLLKLRCWFMFIFEFSWIEGFLLFWVRVVVELKKLLVVFEIVLFMDFLGVLIIRVVGIFLFKFL